MNDQDRERISKERQDNLQKMDSDRKRFAVLVYIFIGILIPLLFAIYFLIEHFKFE
tara:strand:+ start:31885 stop:32052 length:168 start_codon:yes stop_codon:yes gene_type:complete